MDSSENENLLLEQYGRFKRMELEKSPFHFLLANESHIDPNPHQINAFCAAIDAMKTGGIVLADEVGLGKTIEAGLVLRYMLESGAKKVMIALPASLRKQWELELEEKFDLKPVILDRLTVEHDADDWHRMLADGQSARIVITSYDYSSKLMNRFPDVKWDFLIIDEAHNLRNLNGTKRAKRLFELSGGIPKILLTATPLQNSLMDLYGLVSFIDPRIFGSEKVFRQRYIKDDDYDDLKRELTPVLYRTLRRDVADYMHFVKRICKTVDFELSPDEIELYERVNMFLGSAFEYYDDGIEHSLWLSMMRPRLILLRELLADDGFIFVQIDDNEQAYLKVLMDEVFGRESYVNQIVWKRRGGSANPTNRLNNVTDYILLYAKTPGTLINPVFTRDDEKTQEYINKRFNKRTEDGRRYMLAPIERNEKLGLRENLRYEYKGYTPKWGWMMSKSNLEKMDNEGRLHWNSKGRPNRRVFEDEYKGQPVGSLWTDIFVINPMSGERVNFEGQKPEALIKRILELSTADGDWVLDSFLGSGSTAVTAQKMKRKWIGIEMGEHAYTLCKTRIDSAIDGEQSGISKAVNWQGGGGYHFYELAPSLLVKNDKLPVYQINPTYTFEMLCEAICKIEGFKYKPQDIFHGHSSEKRFIHVTKEFVNAEYIRSLSQHLGEGQSLLVYGTKIQSDMMLPDNIEVKKIPKDLLDKCSFESEVR